MFVHIFGVDVTADEPLRQFCGGLDDWCTFAVLTRDVDTDGRHDLVEVAIDLIEFDDAFTLVGLGVHGNTSLLSGA